MYDFNFCQFKGKLASDPTVKTVGEDNKKVMSFNLMYGSRQTTDKEGSHANFIQVEAWGKVVDIFEPILFKGMEIMVYGQLLQNRWRDKEDKPQSVHRLSARTISITDLKFRGVDKHVA